MCKISSKITSGQGACCMNAAYRISWYLYLGWLNLNLLHPFIQFSTSSLKQLNICIFSLHNRKHMWIVNWGVLYLESNYIWSLPLFWPLSYLTKSKQTQDPNPYTQTIFYFSSSSLLTWAFPSSALVLLSKLISLNSSSGNRLYLTHVFHHHIKSPAPRDLLTICVLPYTLRRMIQKKGLFPSSF